FCRCVSNFPCEKFSRATFIPARIIWSSTGTELDAGPMVATILVLLNHSGMLHVVCVVVVGRNQWAGFQARAHLRRKTAQDEIHCLPGRIGDVAKTDLVAAEYAFLHHLLAPLSHSLPKLRFHQDKREWTHLSALD